MPPLRKPDALPPPVLVEDAAGLRRLLEALEGVPEIAVDTEADSFFRYRERVCLIQVSAGERDWLVDPLADLDLGGLGRVLADPERLKVFHDGEYDVLILKRDFGWSFRNLFDTRVAAAALGIPNPGLAAVLAERFGVELDKTLQRSNWAERPLTDRQIEYARLDTRYLVALMHELRPELETRDRLRIVAGECRRLEALEPPERRFDPDEFVRLKGARTLRPLQMRALRELFVLRDRLARDRDLPPFKVLPNPALVELARALPTTPRQLARVDGFSPRHAKRHGEDVLRAVRRAKEAGPLSRVPRLPSRDGTGELDDAQFELHERLKRWRTAKAEAEGIDSSLILNRHVLLRLAKERPTDRNALADVEGLLPWQIELFGDALLELVGDFEAALEAGDLELDRRRRRGSRRR